ncbi:MAG: polysaccharide biosynthesis protein PslG [Solirubrobacteraceae bacterium]|jgi:hypothetical protein|nr:polysaccharide biosynthesis protein PslG [Solirubrobacteraceae bacterium]
MSAIRDRACVRAFVYVFLLASLWFGCTAIKASAATVPAGFYGVNLGGSLMNDAASRPAAFKVMRAGGLSEVRTDALWSDIEPAPPVAGVHTFAWAKYDSFVTDLASNGMRWYPTLGYSTPWAASVAGEMFSPPARDADFATYVAAFAKRYGSDGTFWASHPELPKLPTTVYGIWNEPSNPHFWHGAQATPARYMRLYLAARTAIKSADPGASVATAGLLDSGVINANEYLRAMLGSTPAARNQIDLVGWHPYVGGLDAILASVKRARTTLNQYGLGTVPIAISEVGWHTGFTSAQRAEWLRGLAAELPHAELNVTRLLPYVWTGDPMWQITNPDGSLGQIGSAYFAGMREAFAPQPQKRSKSKQCTTKKRKAVKKTANSSKKSKAAKKKANSSKRSKAAKRCVKKTTSKAAKRKARAAAKKRAIAAKKAKAAVKRAIAAEKARAARASAA